MGEVTTNWQPPEPVEPGAESSPQWAQPPFAPTEQPSQSVPDQPRPPTPYPVVQGPVVVPSVKARPPSPLESGLRATANVLPAILIFAAIFGGLPIWIAIVGALVGSSVFAQVARDMKRRRIAAAREQWVLPPKDDQLR